MIKPIIRDVFFLGQKSEPATRQDLDGFRKTIRYQNIEVEYFDSNRRKQRQKYSGWTAQIIQHEADHLEGKII